MSTKQLLTRAAASTVLAAAVLLPLSSAAMAATDAPPKAPVSTVSKAPAGLLAADDPTDPPVDPNPPVDPTDPPVDPTDPPVSPEPTVDPSTPPPTTEPTVNPSTPPPVQPSTPAPKPSATVPAPVGSGNGTAVGSGGVAGQGGYIPVSGNAGLPQGAAAAPVAVTTPELANTGASPATAWLAVGAASAIVLGGGLVFVVRKKYTPRHRAH